MAANVELNYKKSDGAKKVTIEISSTEPLGMLDVIRVLASVLNQIMTTGKY